MSTLFWTGETVEIFMPPLWVSEVQVNKQLLLVTTTLQAPTKEYRESALVICILDIDTERGGIKISTVSLVSDIKIRISPVAMNEAHFRSALSACKSGRDKLFFSLASMAPYRAAALHTI